MPICEIQPLQESHPLASLASNGDHSFSSVASPVGSRECVHAVCMALRQPGQVLDYGGWMMSQALGFRGPGTNEWMTLYVCTHLHLLCTTHGEQADV